jgi:hypothetical protein
MSSFLESRILGRPQKTGKSSHSEKQKAKLSSFVKKYGDLQTEPCQPNNTVLRK